MQKKENQIQINYKNIVDLQDSKEKAKKFL